MPVFFRVRPGETTSPNSTTTSSTTDEQTIFLCPRGIFGANCDKQAQATFEGVIGTIFTYLLIAGALVAIIFLIWGGIKWITSGGDKTKVESARHTIIGAILGLIVVFASFLIISVVLGTLFGFDIGEGFSLPSLIDQSGALDTGGHNQ